MHPVGQAVWGQISNAQTYWKEFLCSGGTLRRADMTTERVIGIIEGLDQVHVLSGGLILLKKRFLGFQVA